MNLLLGHLIGVLIGQECSTKSVSPSSLMDVANTSPCAIYTMNKRASYSMYLIQVALNLQEALLL